MKLATINNGYTSKNISPQKGLFQGNPIVSYLFLITIEILAILLRKNTRIKGIEMNGHRFLLSLFADDLALLIKNDQASWNQIVAEFSNFERLSGMSINYDKSIVYRFGSIKNTNAKFYSQKGLAWTNEPVTILGLSITADQTKLMHCNLDSLLSKTRTTLNMWSKRSLSLYGKILIVNSLVASQYVYKMSVLPTMPIEYCAQIKSEIQKFI